MEHDQNLTKDQFADALEKGLGRAMLYVKQHGIADVAAILLDACIHNKMYDRQIEQSRAAWLYAMFKDSSQYDHFRNEILSALENPNQPDIGQLSELAREMALDGDGLARAALKDFALKSAAGSGDQDYGGVEEYIQIEGDDAVLEIAKIYGQRLLIDPADDVNCDLSYEDEDRISFARILKEHSYGDPRIKVYFEYLEDNGGLDVSEPPSESQRAINNEIWKQEFLSQYNADTVIEYAKAKSEKNNFVYRRFGRLAQENDLKTVFTELLNAKDDTVRTKLLRVFGNRPLPAIDNRFFDWADSQDEELQVAVFSALANLKDDRIHEFAHKRLKAGKILGWGNSFLLELFEKNFVAGDAQLIMDALMACKPDKDDIHRFGLSITSIAEKNKCDELKALLLYTYENTPCSSCREYAVHYLLEINCLTPDIINECLYDGSEDMRELAGKIKNKGV